ncbi:MAG: hypothetical protein QN140_09020 [Armatimonadota bacterium]|nr:hypothetical protein [Armatimonadota bacterium]
MSLLVVAAVVLAACEQSLGLRLLAPEDNAVISCSSVDAGLVRFSWTPVAAARSYTIVIYDASGNQFLTRTVTTTTLELQLPCGSSYSWQVAANPGGASYWTPRRRFTLTVEKPFLVSPPNNSTVSVNLPGCNGLNVVQFTWTVVLNATSYRVDVFNDATGVLVGSTVVTGATNTTATVSWSATACATYRWKVTAIKTAPNPPVASDEWRFTTVP